MTLDQATTDQRELLLSARAAVREELAKSVRSEGARAGRHTGLVYVLRLLDEVLREGDQ